MDIDKIKQRILDLAIRGKLVSQDPNDEPASVLIEKIKAEKEKMVKKGKIKPSKDDSYIYKASDNCYYENGNKIIFKEPLDVSNNIVWVKGKSILLKMEKALPKGTFFQYIDIDSIDNKTNIINKKILSVDQAPSRASRKVFKESTLFSMVRPYLRNIAFVGEQNENSIASTGFYVCTPINGIHPKYLFLLLTSDYVVNGLNEQMKGDNSPSIRGSDIENFWFPIPSYSYQIKVLSFLDKINLRIDEITKNEFELKKLCYTFKSKILDFFFGDDSSYKSYYANRHIKRLKDIIPDEKVGDGDWVLSENMDNEGEYSLVQLKHIGIGRFIKKSFQHINKDFFISNACTEIKENYILINRLISNQMNVCLLPKLDFKCITAVDICWIAPSEEYCQKYLLYYFMSPEFQKQVQYLSSGTTRKRISKTNLLNININIHELNDQFRIVNKIDDLFAKIEKICSY